MKKILITGCSGFIGSTLCDKLIQNNNISIIGIDNFDPFYSKQAKLDNIKNLKHSKNFAFHEIDLLDEKALTKIIEHNKPDLVIHLAAKAGLRNSMQYPLSYFQANVDGTITLLETMKKYNVSKMIFASSSSVYGENSKIPFAESDSLDNIISFYAASKMSCEQINKIYHLTHNFSIINLRFFTVYGPRQRPDLAIHKFFKAILNGEEITIYGDGSMKRDYTYIDDIVNGIESAINYISSKNIVFETINLGNNKPVTLNELVNKIALIANKKPILKYFEKPKGDVPITFADINKAQKLLSYNPKTSLDDGLKKFHNWLCNQKLS